MKGVVHPLQTSPAQAVAAPCRGRGLISLSEFLESHSPLRRKGRAVPPCVDGPWNARLLLVSDQLGSVMCPAYNRGINATGPDEIRRRRANQIVALEALGEPRLSSVPGLTGSPSN
ncbi:protein of unknown function (plasmid) [Shinella sp. WSC3-e]|nr:hypothetical protein SHINE37_100139 [Rhizobiaceae bacterium]CAK7261684.1 protein of unknown function [Shinella sp. WSC3-e]